MSVKRSSSSTRSSGGSDAGAKVGRQELYDRLKQLAETGQAFTPVDVSLSIGAGEPQVSRALLGLAAEGLLEKLEAGKYRVAQAFLDLTMAEYLKAFARASKTDSTRQRDLSDIARLKQNNDIMRGKLLQAIAERDHYLGVLRQRGIDPGTPPVVAPIITPVAAPASAAEPNFIPTGAAISEDPPPADGPLAPAESRPPGESHSDDHPPGGEGAGGLP
jgi:hypothetical protein